MPVVVVTGDEREMVEGGKKVVCQEGGRGLALRDYVDAGG